MAKKKERNKIPLPIFIIICAVLLYGMYTSLSTLALAIWGDSAMGTVDTYSTRVESTKTEPNSSRIVFKGYWFLVNGREYRGYVAYGSDEAWPDLSEGETRSERIRYLPFFPYINKPAMLSDFGLMGEGAIIYHIAAPVGCLLLLLLVIRTETGMGGKKKKKAAKKTAAPQAIQARSDSDMFCLNCGNKLPEGAAFCTSCGAQVQPAVPDVCMTCGTAIPDGAGFCINCGTAVNPPSPEQAQDAPPVYAQPPSPSPVYAQPQAAPPAYALPQSPPPAYALPQSPPPAYAPMQSPPVYAQPQGGAGLIGFSNAYFTPEIQAAARRNRKIAVGFMWFLVLLPLLGMPIAGLLVKDLPFGEAVIIGVGIALFMLVFNLLMLRGSKKPIWEGVVVNKYKKEKYARRDDNETYTEYTTVITTDAGRKKTIVERDYRRIMYDYLAVGDRVRHYPMLGTYEKYDKSRDRIIYCNICATMNPIQNDRCKKCNNLLFK